MQTVAVKPFRFAQVAWRLFLLSKPKTMNAEAVKDKSVPISIPLPWGTIAGKAWGSPSRKPVLALHGWLDNAGVFDSLIPALSDDFYVVAIDLPGHGQSSHRPKGCRYHFVEYVADVKLIVDALNWEKFSFLGHSMGAGISSLFAASLPNRVEAMVLMESLGVMTKGTRELPGLLGKALNDPRLEEKNGDKAKVYPSMDAVVQRVLEGHIYDNSLRKEDALVIARRGVQEVEGGYRFTRDLRLKERSLLYMTDDMLESFLKEISCPTLLIMGKETFIPAAATNKRIEQVPKDKLKVVQMPGGHHLILYNSAQLAPLISTFLSSRTVHPDYTAVSKLCDEQP